jgi:DNA-binding NarL/FixJ family response regulator
VDAQDLFREALRAVLEHSWGLEVVAEATTAAEALAAVRRTAPDVVLTSYRLPGEADGAVVAELAQHHPDLPAVVITAVPPEECLYVALQTGAQGFLMKETDAELVVKAISAVRAGEIWVQREALARSVTHMRAHAVDASGAPIPLTPRETEVLNLLAVGASTAEIAEALFITSSTVRVHVLRILEKFGVSTRIAAVRSAIRAGLVAP